MKHLKRQVLRSLTSWLANEQSKHAIDVVQY